MAHQYVDEVLGVKDETPHGRAFREACARIGVDARASGVPDATAADVDPEQARVLERVRRLLALADSPNRHEAEAAMAAAQRLMLRHNLDAGRRPEGADEYRFVHLGTPSGRIAEHERLVAVILGKHFFVEAIWVPVYRAAEGKRGSQLEICGSPDNVAIAEYVHGYLVQTAERLWREHRSARAIRGNRDRRTYLAGVMVGFADKLAKQETAHRGEGLVWVPDADLPRYLRRRHPHVRHVRHAGPRRTDAWAHGRQAGRDIVLHRPVEGAARSRGSGAPRKVLKLGSSAESVGTPRAPPGAGEAWKSGLPRTPA